MSTPKSLNRDSAKQNPESVFSSPIDIVAEPLLTRGEKLATLERWRQNLFQQLHASGEGMRTQGYSSEHVKTLDLIEQANYAMTPAFLCCAAPTSSPDRSGALRVVEASWPKPDATEELPAQVTEVVEI
jgi:hypothetical protein